MSDSYFYCHHEGGKNVFMKSVMAGRMCGHSSTSKLNSYSQPTSLAAQLVPHSVMN